MSRLLAKLKSVSDLPQNIAVLNHNERYNILFLEINPTTPHGPALIATVNVDGEDTKVYLPARYATMLTPKYISDHNKNVPMLQVVYKGLVGRAHFVEFEEIKK